MDVLGVAEQAAIRRQRHLDDLRKRRDVRLRNLVVIMKSHETDEKRVVLFADLQCEHLSHWQREDPAVVRF